MQKKFIAFPIIFAFFVNMLALSVFAEAAPSVTAGTASGREGKTVQIPITLSDNSGFSNLAIEIGYDSTALRLKDVSQNERVGATFTKAPDFTVNPYNMSWDSASNTSFSGTLVTLTFDIIAVKAGTYPITVDYYKGRSGNYTDGNNVNYDEDFNPLGLEYLNGSVTVISTGTSSGGGGGGGGGSASGGSGSSGGGSMSVSGISLGLSMSEEIGTVYAAIYDSADKLLFLKEYEARDVVNVTFDTVITGSYVKIMWWKDEMKPMCEAKVIPL